jgi:hypothetical protein
MSGVSGSGSSPIPSRGSLADFASGIIDASKKQTDVKKREENRNFNIQVTDSTRSDTSAGQKRLTATLPQARQVSDMNTSLSRYEQAMSKPQFSISSLVAKVLVLLAKQGELQGKTMLAQAETNNLQFQAGMNAAKQAYKSALIQAVGSFVNAGMSGMGIGLQLKGMRTAMKAANAEVSQVKAQMNQQSASVTTASGKARSVNTQDAGVENQQKARQSSRSSASKLSSQQTRTSTEVNQRQSQQVETQSKLQQNEVRKDSKDAKQNVNQAQERASRNQIDSKAGSEQLEANGNKLSNQSEGDLLSQMRRAEMEASSPAQRKGAAGRLTEQPASKPRDAIELGQQSAGDTRKSSPLPETKPLETSQGAKPAGLDVDSASKTTDKTGSNRDNAPLDISRLREDVYNRVNQQYMLQGQAFTMLGSIGQGGSMIGKGAADQAQMEQQSYSQLFGSTSQSFAKISQNIDENRQNVLSMVSGWMSSLLSISRGA